MFAIFYVPMCNKDIYLLQCLGTGTSEQLLVSQVNNIIGCNLIRSNILNDEDYDLYGEEDDCRGFQYYTDTEITQQKLIDTLNFSVYDHKHNNMYCYFAIIKINPENILKDINDYRLDLMSYIM